MLEKLINTLKKFIKWMFCDRVVAFSIVVGIILLLLTLTVYAKWVGSIRYRGINYNVGETAYSRLLFKMATPALTIKLLLRGMPVETIPQYLIQYLLMFAIQIAVYGIVGKVVSVMSSDRVVAVCICLSIVLLALALAYEINPADDWVIYDVTKGKPFYLLLLVTNLPVLFAGQYISGVFGKTALLSLILFPFMFIVQILLYGFFGKLVSNILSSLIKST